MRCIECFSKVYYLSDGRVKCSKCLKRFSPKKIARQKELILAFSSDLTARQASKRVGVTYVTAKRFYDLIRSRILIYLQECYEENRDNILEYDEYLYLDHSKRGNKKNIFDAYNFLTFDYGEKVYNILMPSLERYKAEFLEDGLEEIYYKEFSRFLKIHRIAKLRSLDNTIIRFWAYFDQFIKKYKGVERENFIYYLKEAEFKFNVPIERREDILLRLLGYSFSTKQRD
ncbi:MAG: transposase [Hydrogenimonas sp.]|nr:transposase [Hydrogenimonas sp.]